MKYLLIHGFGTKVNYDLGFYKYPPTEDFLAWKEDIGLGNAKIFSWGIRQEKNWRNVLSPLPYLELYKREKSLVKNKYLLLELHKAIEETNPEIIVCHSMGCFLLENYCGLHNLPKSVQKIVFSQGDIVRIPNLEKQLGQNPKLKLENYYCGWDQALLTSVSVNLYKPAGLFGIRINKELGNQIQNIFWPLGNLHKNCHVDAINSIKFKEKVNLDKIH
jgi:hypothetical protein